MFYFEAMQAAAAKTDAADTLVCSCKGQIT